jgi:hypothetical protein
VRLYALLFAIGLAVYGTLAWDRLGRQSPAPHFVYQADAWLHGQLAVDPPLPNDDWAMVEHVELDDGSRVSGRTLFTRPQFFRTLAGDVIKVERIKQHQGRTAYVSFPVVPALLMLPGAAIWGRTANDVIPTLLVAALILPLAFATLRRLASAGLSTRTQRDDLWLVGMLAFGTVLFFSSVQGKVWYTAHVVGVALALLYVYASIEAKRPVLAGIALGLAALTRTPMAFMFPLFLFEAWRMAAKAKSDEVPAGASGSMNLREARTAMLRGLVKPVTRYAIPIAALAVAGMVYNYVRFDSPTEFGHTYLALGNGAPVRQQANIEQWGLANYHYLSRNLTVAFTMLPDLYPQSPWVQFPGHGMAIWVTTPVLLFVVWPREKTAWHRPLWITTTLVALPSFFYMNTGWVQFGYRFSLDYIVFLVLLVAIGGRPLGKLAKGLIIAGVVINLFGAYTFDRYWKHYRADGKAYNAVVAP